MRKLLLWLVMVIVMVALILGGTAAFLYSRTGEDSLPQEPVTFGEAALEPNGWDWVVPVLGDSVNKTYQSLTNLTVQKLGTFTDTVPQLVLPEWVTRAEVTITAPDGTSWSAGVEDCNTYTYTQNGEYDLVVTAYHQENEPPADAQGWYAYHAAYMMQLTPTVTLSSERAAQGSVVAIQLSRHPGRGTVAGNRPGFRLVPQDDQRVHGLHPGDLQCRERRPCDDADLRQPYPGSYAVGEQDRIRQRFGSGGGGLRRCRGIPQRHLAAVHHRRKRKTLVGGFPAPQRGGGHPGLRRGADGGRAAQRPGHGAYLCASPGETITAPQSGKVVFAGTLTLTGGTVVIDHGCGVKSYLYGLQTVTAQQGQSVSTGDAVGTAGEEHDLIYELRIGNKSVDPDKAILGSSGLQYRESE